MNTLQDFRKRQTACPKPVWGIALFLAIVPLHLALHIAPNAWSNEPLSSANLSVAVPDHNLNRAIRQTLSKTNGETITLADMESLTMLDASVDALWSPAEGSAPIFSLEGLQLATGLVSLSLEGHGYHGASHLPATTDLSPLAACTHLENLDLSWNWLSQTNLPAILSALPSLRNLNLLGNSLPGPFCLTNLSQLRSLDVSYNPLTYLGLPASIDLSQLRLTGFRKSDVIVLGFYLRSPVFEGDGRISLRVSGASGKRVEVQRSTNLIDWAGWQTGILVDNAAEFFVPSGDAAAGFFRIQHDPAN